MRKTKILGVLALVLALMLCLLACTAAPAATVDPTEVPAEELTAEPTAVPADPPTEETAEPAAQAEEAPSKKYDLHADSSIFDDPDQLREYVENRTQRDADTSVVYAAKVQTLESGVRVRKVPNDRRGWNIGIMNAENRGCTACHSLEDAIEWLPIAHNGLQGIKGDHLNVNTCLNCHTGRQIPVFNRPIPLDTGVHEAHMSSDKFTGNCFSCHYLDNGTYQLWDDVKYDLFQEITLVSNVEGDFRFDQNVITPNDEVYYMLAANTNPNGIALYSNGDPSVLENWVIPVGGMVDQPIELRIQDISEDQMVTRILKSNCKVAGIGDGLICNVEVKGLPVETLCQIVGVQDGATAVTFTSADNGNPSYEVQWLIDHHAMLVFYMNGELLPAELGYPCALWMDGVSAGPMRKYINSCTFSTPDGIEEYEDDCPGTRIVGDEENFYNKPVFAILNVEDGQIFKAGEPITFEGYVDAFDECVASVEFSLDRGKTWTKYETPGTTQERWVYWYYTITPPAPGSYVLKMRATSDTGRVSYKNLSILFYSEE